MSTVPGCSRMEATRCLRRSNSSAMHLVSCRRGGGTIQGRLKGRSTDRQHQAGRRGGACAHRGPRLAVRLLSAHPAVRPPTAPHCCPVRAPRLLPCLVDSSLGGAVGVPAPQPVVPDAPHSRRHVCNDCRALPGPGKRGTGSCCSLPPSAPGTRLGSRRAHRQRICAVTCQAGLPCLSDNGQEAMLHGHQPATRQAVSGARQAASRHPHTAGVAHSMAPFSRAAAASSGAKAWHTRMCPAALIWKHLRRPDRMGQTGEAAVSHALRGTKQLHAGTSWPSKASCWIPRSSGGSAAGIWPVPSTWHRAHRFAGTESASTRARVQQQQ